MKQQQFSLFEHHSDDFDDITDRHQSSLGYLGRMKQVTSDSDFGEFHMNSRSYRSSTSIVIQPSEDSAASQETSSKRRATRASTSSEQDGASNTEIQHDTVDRSKQQNHNSKSEEPHATLSPGGTKRPTVNHTYRDHYHDPNLELLQLERNKPSSDEDDEKAFQKLVEDTEHQMNDDIIGSQPTTRSLRQRRVSTGSSSSSSPSTQRSKKGLPCLGTETIVHRTSRGGVTVAFPEKLYEMLRTVEEEGQCDIVSWQPHGRCFLIHKKSSFVDQIIPRFFHQSKLTSFQRQLNLYGFIRLTTGEDRGAYYHELFLRGRIDLCRRMIRTRIKGNGMKALSSPSTEPNFYLMEYCTEEGGKHAPSNSVSSNEDNAIFRKYNNTGGDDELIDGSEPYEVDDDCKSTAVSDTSSVRISDQKEEEQEDLEPIACEPDDMLTIHYSSVSYVGNNYFKSGSVSGTVSSMNKRGKFLSPSRGKFLPSSPGKFHPASVISSTTPTRKRELFFPTQYENYPVKGPFAHVSPYPSPNNSMSNLWSNDSSPYSLNVRHAPLLPLDRFDDPLHKRVHSENSRDYRETSHPGATQRASILTESQPESSSVSLFRRAYGASIVDHIKKYQCPGNAMRPHNDSSTRVVEQGSESDDENVDYYTTFGGGVSNAVDQGGDCGAIDDGDNNSSMMRLSPPNTGDEVFFEGNKFCYLEHDDILLTLPSHPFDSNFMNDLK